MNPMRKRRLTGPKTVRRWQAGDIIGHTLLTAVIFASILTACGGSATPAAETTDQYTLVLTTDPHTVHTDPDSKTNQHSQLEEELRQTWGSWIIATSIRQNDIGEPELEIWIRGPEQADTPAFEAVRRNIEDRAADLGIPHSQIRIEETPHTLEDAARSARQQAETAIGELDTDVLVELTVNPRGEIQQIASNQSDEIQARLQETQYRQHTVQPLTNSRIQELPRQQPNIWEAYLRTSTSFKAITALLTTAGIAIAISTGWKWRQNRAAGRRAWPWATVSLTAAGGAGTFIWSVYRYLQIVYING